MAVEYRAPRNDEELEETFSCTASAFGAHEEFWRSITRHDPWYCLENTRACFVDGKAVSVVQIFERPIRFGPCVVKMGGVGSVGTDPDYRRSGYGAGTLRDSVHYMRAAGYDLSVLFTGVPAHYFRAGWVTHPTYRFQLEMPGELPDRPGGVSIEVCDPDWDLHAMRGIYDRFNATRTGTLVRTEPYWVNRRKWRYQHPDLLLTARRNGSLSAYLAGGTELLVDLRSGRKSVAHVIDLGGITELKEISQDGKDLVIGALAVLADIAASPLVRPCGTDASIALRKLARLSGNWCEVSVVCTAIMPQPISTPTAAGTIAPLVGMTLPTVAPLPQCTSGMAATCR